MATELGMESKIVQFWKMEAGRSLDQVLVEQQGPFSFQCYIHMTRWGVEVGLNACRNVCKL
jgi:hypothetical protein